VFGELTNRLALENLTNILAEAREQLTMSMSPSEIALRGYDPFNILKLPDSVTSGAPAMGTGQDMFSSADGKFRLIFVEAKSELRTYKECAAWLKSVQEIVAKLQTSGEISRVAKINYTGRPAFVSEIAGGMEHDMTTSVGLTAFIIAILFWISHRRWKPMLWLLVLLALILLSTIAIGGLIFGTINVVSLGFAGILLGLAVDYGVVHYQEAMAKPDATIPEIRNAIRPSIIWAAVTTISAFLVLNLGGLPGLGQLGSIVAIGIALSALVMLFAFLPPLFRDRIKKRREQIAAGTFPTQASEEKFVPNQIAPRQKKIIFGVTALLILFCVTVLFGWGFPKLDRTPDALRPRGSQA
ncbi:MAG: MMPL family transporter, partial [Limisphaerales bacterium]